jgi:ArsR family transcriptional regulator
MRAFLQVAKALADENRARVLLALRVQELCVCQVTELLQLAPSTVSKHLSVLYQAGLVESRKKGRWMHYRLPGDHAPLAARASIQWAESLLAHDARVNQDAQQLKKILQTDPIELCKRQSGK